MEPATEEAAPLPQTLPANPSPDAVEAASISTSGSSASKGHDDHNGTVHPLHKERPISGVVPPYWSHYRDASRSSQASLDQSGAIILEDHTEDPNSDTSRGLWAKSVTVDDYVIVQGKSSVGAGAYVVWNCKIQTLEGGSMVIRMRYSEFDDLRQRLLAAFPHAQSALPALPPKSVLFKFRPSFLETRRIGLEYFLNCILLNPEFSGSPIVKDFLFGRSC